MTITDKDKEQFFKAVMSDQPYEEEIFLFDKKLKLRVASFSVEQNNDILVQVNYDKENKIAENTEAYFITLACYRLGIALQSVDDVTFLPKLTKEKYKEDPDKKYSYVAARAEGFKKWQHFKLRVFLDAHNEFEKKLEELSKEVFSENFWKADVQTS